ncbi:hypothetical protein EV580_1285 [Mycobacterium sp. BK086]|uniref:hypothetical protein n=1 Tax=Mycobacterium sp. BK086 TaxID=2512165 RepID=UPI00105E7225|nr:hypothetical protein [Mycobacterium sp. BK086]TDO18104.1 hypothetical protein EV580_1285 [Mycobacterium sp. BK086]
MLTVLIVGGMVSILSIAALTKGMYTHTEPAWWGLLAAAIVGVGLLAWWLGSIVYAALLPHMHHPLIG